MFYGERDVYFIYLENTHKEEVNIGKFGELVDEVFGEEGHHGVLAGDDLVVAEKLVVDFDCVHVERPQRRWGRILPLWLALLGAALISRGLRGCSLGRLGPIRT